jgi:phytoene dehydrogenase-like protein
MAADFGSKALSLDSGNYWFYRHQDVDAIYRHGLTASGLDEPEPSGLFLTVTTLKDPSKHQRGRHTMEAFAFVGYDAFKKWENTRYGSRPDDYEAMKRELTKRMLRTAGRIVPGIEEKLVFSELGTPLTNRHYVAATAGNLYGTEKTLSQIGPWAFQTETEIEGLSLCGASTVSHGVLGATLSGLVAAARILDCPVKAILNQKGPAPKIYPSENPSAWPQDLRPLLVPKAGEAASFA